MNLGNAIETYRFWSRHNEVLRERAAKQGAAITLDQLDHSTKDTRSVLEALRRDGVAVIENYWSREKAEAARGEIDRLIVEYSQGVHLSSGNSDKRMFGVEAVSPLLAEFHNDSFLQSIGEAVSALTLYNFTTLGARIDASEANNGSGDGWHRDAHGFQFKAITYLSDVDDCNGPFEYLLGSHKLWRATLDTARADLPPPPQSRYSNEAINRMLARGWTKCRRFRGLAGTLLLVNTAGIHRGMPLKAGSRYALTNYFFHPFQIDRARINSFPSLLPGATERIIDDLRLS